MENYKDVKDHEGLYLISDLGNVKNAKTGRILKPDKDRKGYLRVFLSNKSIKKTIRIHILVAQSFLNHNNDGTLNIVVDHKDNDKSNNKKDNLQLISNRLNASKDKSNKTSKYIGVSWDKSRNKWSAEIRIGKNRKRLGRFANEIDAHNAYQKELNAIQI